MRAVILMALLAASTLTSYAQCKYLRNEVDEFTGIEVVETKSSLIWSGFKYTASVRLKRLDSLYILTFGMNQGSIFSVDEGAKLMFILENDSVVSTTALEYTIAEGGYIANVGTIYGAQIDFHLDADLLKTLSEFGVKKFRIYTTDGYYEKDIIPKNANDIKNLIPCVIKK